VLVDFSIQNFSSINKQQELSMVASTATKEDGALNNTYPVNSFGVKELLKSAAIFGANGAGKSNFVKGLKILKSIVTASVQTSDNKILHRARPFLLKEDVYNIPTEFEISFIADGNLYRYGLSLGPGVIEEEWLYWTKASRETMLFHRHKQNITYNNRSFKEAKMFVKKSGDSLVLQKTRTDVPFISVLHQFDGERSTIVCNWFRSLNIIAGIDALIDDKSQRDFTIKLFQESNEFKVWALEILSSMQINDIRITEVDLPRLKSGKTTPEFQEVQNALDKYLANHRMANKLEKRLRVEIVKYVDGKEYNLPLQLESEGNQKMIQMLGPLFDAIKNNKILIVDEFEKNFHTLLSKHILSTYNKKNFGQSQLIITCHDTNLLTKELFRRDQIWFIEKNTTNESHLYSLVEYKEHYTRQDQSYSKDYLEGKYGAVPLFSSIEELGDVLDD